MAKIISGIYKITSPSNRIYIGQAVDINRRWEDHKKSVNKKNLKSKIISSLRKYGFNEHKFEIVQLCQPDKLNELEKYYVDLFQTFNSKNGLNLRDGGGSKGALSEKTKIKLSNSLKGRTVWNKGIPLTKEQKELISSYNLGRKQTQEEKNKRADSNRGKSRNSKKIIDKKTGIIYNRIQDCAKENNISRRTFSRITKIGSKRFIII